MGDCEFLSKAYFAKGLMFMKGRGKLCGATLVCVAFLGMYCYGFFSVSSARAQGDASAPIIAPIGATATIVDEDLDGLSDGAEHAFGTNPHAPDTEEDGYSDYEEIFTYFSNPLDSCSPDPRDCASPAAVVIVLPLPGKAFGAVGTASLLKLEMKRGYVEASWAPPISGSYEGFILLKNDTHFISDSLQKVVMYKGKATSYKDIGVAAARGNVWYYALFAYHGEAVSTPLFAAISLKDVPQDVLVPTIRGEVTPQAHIVAPLAVKPLFKTAPFDIRNGVYTLYQELMARIFAFLFAGMLISAGGLFFMRLFTRNYPKKRRK